MVEMQHPTEPVEAPSASPASQSRSIWSIMVGVFTGPSAAFESFKAQPSWVMPLIVVMLLSGINGALMGPYSAQTQVDLLSSSTVIPQEAMDEMIANAEEGNAVSSFVGGAIFLVVISLVASGVVMIFGKFLFGGSAKFLAVWGVTLLVDLISMIGGLLRLPLVFAKESIYVSYGFAALMPDKDFTSILYSLAYYCDFFWFWSAIVAGIGYATLFGISRGKGMTASFVTFFLFIALTIAVSAGGLSLAGVDVSFF